MDAGHHAVERAQDVQRKVEFPIGEEVHLHPGQQVRGSLPLGFEPANLERERPPRPRRQLGRFALQIERTSVRFEDVNGPRGGVDALCRIKIVLNACPTW